MGTGKYPHFIGLSSFAGRMENKICTKNIRGRMEMCIRDRHTTPQRALAGMLAKHIVSLYDMCFDEEAVYPMDTWNEKITDSLNYLFLLKAIVKEGHTN